MELATIHVSGVNAKVVQKAPVPVNIIGGYVDVIFDDDWDGLVRTAVIHGAKDLDVVNVGNRFDIPQEAVSESGIRLKVGFYGVSQDGGRGIPTLWADLGVIQEAADPSGDESTDPALPVWAQLQALIGDLNNLDTTAKETIVAAINEALTKGGADPAQVARLVEEYLEQNPITADQIGAVGKEELPAAINEALAQAKASGEFKGEPGEPGQPGKDYVLTEADKSEIAEMAAELVDVPEGSGGSGTLLPETVVEPEKHFSGFTMESTPVGAKMAVIIDGTPHVTTHVKLGEGADSYDLIGNIALLNPEFVGTEYDTGEPFIAMLYSDGSKFFFADGASHKVAICTVDALDEVYIRALNSLESGEAKEKTDTLTFDGNLENVEKVSVDNVYYLVKLYDGFVERSELVGGTVTLSDNTVRDLTEDNLVDSTESFGVPGYQFGNGVGVAIDGTFTMDGTTLTRGIWCMYTDQRYVKELKAPKAIFDMETEDSAPGSFIVEVTTPDGDNFTVNKTYEEIVTAWGDGLHVLAMMEGESITIPLTGLDINKGNLIFEMSAGIEEGVEMTLMLICSPGNEWDLIQKAIPTMEAFENALTGVAKVPTATVGQTIKVKSVDDNGVPTEWEAVDFPSVPTKVSQLANDSRFQTESEVTAIVEEAIADIDIPSGGGGSGGSGLMLAETLTLEEDVNTVTFTLPSPCNKVVIDFVGRVNNADDSLSDGEASASIKPTRYVASGYISGNLAYIRKSGSNLRSVMSLSVLGENAVCAEIFKPVKNQANIASAAVFGVAQMPTPLNSVCVFLPTATNFFKAGSIFKVYWG